MRKFSSPGPHWPQRAYENRFGEPRSTEEKYGMSDDEMDSLKTEFGAMQARIEEIAIKEFDADTVLKERHIRSDDGADHPHGTMTAMSIVLKEGEKQLADEELHAIAQEFLNRLDEEKIFYCPDDRGYDIRVAEWNDITIEVLDFLDPR